MTENTALAIILPCCAIGLIYAMVNYLIIKKIDILPNETNENALLNDK